MSDELVAMSSSDLRNSHMDQEVVHETAPQTPGAGLNHRQERMWYELSQRERITPDVLWLCAVAALTQKIRWMTAHMRAHHKDFHSRRQGPWRYQLAAEPGFRKQARCATPFLWASPDSCDVQGTGRHARRQEKPAALSKENAV